MDQKVKEQQSDNDDSHPGSSNEYCQQFFFNFFGSYTSLAFKYSVLSVSGEVKSRKALRTH